jgi:AraC-like DNA-binding protein
MEIIIYAGAVQGIFLALLLTTSKNRRRKPNRILAILLITLSVSIIHSLIEIKGIHVPYKIKEPFILLIGPLILFYIRELTETKMFELKDVIHFIPFFSFFIILIPMWVHGIDSGYGKFLKDNAFIITRILWLIVVIQYSYYWTRIIRMIHKHRKKVETEFSTLEGKTLSWIKEFLHIFGLFLLVLPVTLIIILHTENYFFIDRIICLALSYTIFVLGYYGLYQEEVFSTLSEEISIQKKAEKKEEGDEKAILPRDTDEVRRILTFINENKPFLDEGITLTKLAEKLDITRNQLSSIINNDLGSSFYDLINNYRVEEVKRLMADPVNKNYTILALAFDAGFSSKSTFNSIFKKVTGLTPSKYRESL